MRILWKFIHYNFAFASAFVELKGFRIFDDSFPGTSSLNYLSDFLMSKHQESLQFVLISKSYAVYSYLPHPSSPLDTPMSQPMDDLGANRHRFKMCQCVFGGSIHFHKFGDNLSIVLHELLE